MNRKKMSELRAHQAGKKSRKEKKFFNGKTSNAFFRTKKKQFCLKIDTEANYKNSS
jgi:hypothetical protein